MMTPTVDILLVDDESRNLDALEAILEDSAYRLLRAENAEQALRLLLQNHVAAIVLDIKMPEVSGFELARIIKDTKRFRETPIIFLTAHLVDDQDVLVGYGAGGVDYLTKPISPEVLRHKIAVIADLYRKTRELAELNEKLAELNERLEERVKDRTAELERSEEALRMAAQQKDQFIAVLAHELRNPLAPLRTGLDLLLETQAEDAAPVVARTMNAMNRQLDHIVRLIDDLLDVSRISRGLLDLRRELVDLSAIVVAAVESTRPWFLKRSHTLSVDVPQELPASVDPTRIAQIVTNLLHNAAKFTADHGTVDAKLRIEAGVAILTVTDSGRGIAPEQLEQVFEMFTRIHGPGANTEPGLGVGLALARRLAALHGGTLVATSEGEGRGTTLTLRLPILGSEHQPVGSTAPSDETRKANAPLTVVIVEDNEDAARGLADLLELRGHRVAIAATGQHGIDLILSSRPELVLCDLGLPEVDGLTVCRQIRTLPTEIQPMMVALTGWGRADDRRLTREAGFDHHLVKPVSANALETILVRALDARSPLRPL